MTLPEQEFSQESTEVGGLLCRIPAFGERVRRFPHPDGRLYFTVESGICLYSGITGYIDKFWKKPGEDEPLIEYRVKHGANHKNALRLAASYGTFGHQCAAELMSRTDEVSLALDILPDFERYCLREGMVVENYWNRLCNDLKSFAQFVYEREVEPLAVEYCVYDKLKGVATPLDLVCRLKFNGKTVVANVNFKFRESPNLYPKDTKQTCIETMLFNQRFVGTENEITHNFVWMPVNWRGETPTYKLENTTGKYTREMWEEDHGILVTKKAIHFDLNEGFLSKAGGKIHIGKPVNPNRETVMDFCKRYISTT